MAAFNNMSLETFAPNLVSLTGFRLQILGKTQTGVFLISRFLVNLIKKNCHNSRTNDDIDIKLEPVTKLEKKTKTISRKFADQFMSANCDVIIMFLIYGQFGAIRKPDSEKHSLQSLHFH